MPCVRTDKGKPHYDGVKRPEREVLGGGGGTSAHQLQEDGQLQTSTEELTTKNQLQDPTEKHVHGISYKTSTISANEKPSSL